jgi:hypothetical protein
LHTLGRIRILGRLKSLPLADRRTAYVNVKLGTRSSGSRMSFT